MRLDHEVGRESRARLIWRWGNRKCPYLLFLGSTYKTTFHVDAPRSVHGMDQERRKKIVQRLVDWCEEEDSCDQ
jgi:hypothetical protein